jgi:hypothetical protein
MQMKRVPDGFVGVCCQFCCGLLLSSSAWLDAVWRNVVGRRPGKLAKVAADGCLCPDSSG